MDEPLDLDAIRARCEAATPGPWAVRPGGDGWEVESHDYVVADVPDEAGFGDAEADSEFIAAARTDVPALVAEVERLRSEVAKWQRRTSEATWHGEYTMGRWAPEIRHVEPCDCDEDEEVAGKACMDNSEWLFAVFAAGGAFAERLICILPRVPPDPDEDNPEAAPLVLRSEAAHAAQ